MNGGQGLPPFTPMFGKGMSPMPSQQQTVEGVHPRFLPNVANTIAAAMTNQNRVPPGLHRPVNVPLPSRAVGHSMSTGILRPHDHDVMCGRGQMTTFHRGNVWFRHLVQCNQQFYRESAIHTKILICGAIVQAVQNQNPPGRFIECNNHTGIWYQIPYKQAINMTSQTFQECYAVDNGVDGLDLKTVGIFVRHEVGDKVVETEVLVRVPPPLKPVETTPSRTPAKTQEGLASVRMPLGAELAMPAARPFTPVLPKLRAMPPVIPGLSAMAPTAPIVPPASWTMPQSALSQAQVNMVLAAFAQGRMNRPQVAKMPPGRGTLGEAPSRIPTSAAPSRQPQTLLAPKVPTPRILAPVAKGKTLSSMPFQMSAPRTPAAVAPAPESRSTFALDNLANIPAVHAKAPPRNQGIKRHLRDQSCGEIPRQSQSMRILHEREQLARQALEKFTELRYDALKCSLPVSEQSFAASADASRSPKEINHSHDSCDSNAQSLLDENNSGKLDKEMKVDDQTEVEVEERLRGNMSHAKPTGQQKAMCSKMAKCPDDASSTDVAEAQDQASTENGQSLVQMLENGEETLPHKSHHHHHHNLNENTLNLLKSHLQSYRGEYLDEDMIAARILKMDRIKRRRFQCDLSDASEDEDTGLRQAHQAVEDYSLTLDFYNNTVTRTRKENPDTVLDKRTLNWLRKEMGLHCRDDLWETPVDNQAEQSDEADDEDGLQGAKRRRYTRGVARSTRIRKREQRSMMTENKGLHALMLAVTDLEKEFECFQESVSRVSYTLEILEVTHALCKPYELTHTTNP